LSVTYNEPWFTTTRNFWVGPGDQIWPDQKIKYVRHIFIFEGTTSPLVTFYNFVDTQVITNFIFPRFKLKAVYMYVAGFYTYSIFALLFWEIRRSDFGISMTHHVATVCLIALSYIFRYTGFWISFIYLCIFIFEYRSGCILIHYCSRSILSLCQFVDTLS